MYLNMQYQTRRQLVEGLLNLQPASQLALSFRYPLVLEIERDGDCQFRAFAKELNKTDSGNRDPTSMRVELVDYMLQQIEQERCNKATDDETSLSYDETSLSYWLPRELLKDPQKREKWAQGMGVSALTLHVRLVID